MIPPIRKPADAADDAYDSSGESHEHPADVATDDDAEAVSPLMIFGVGAAVIFVSGLALGAWLF